MDPSERMLLNRSLYEEVDDLNDLWLQCEGFLQRWKAYSYNYSDRPTDAFVAIFELQKDIVARRLYILASIHQEELPF